MAPAGCLEMNAPAGYFIKNHARFISFVRIKNLSERRGWKLLEDLIGLVSQPLHIILFVDFREHLADKFLSIHFV